MTALTPRPGILGMAPYVPGESTVPGVNRIMKLSSNEGALGPSPKAVEAYRSVTTELHRYPDGGSLELRDTLAARHGLDAQRIICGAGSDEILTLLARAYAGPGDEILFGEHAFVMYPLFAQQVGATPVKAPEADFRLDVDALLSKVSERTRIVYIANPNNPTGTYIPEDEVARLRAGLRDDILLVIDAAYAEYVSRNDYTPGMGFVHDADNVVMTRTFSKIYALGGLRLGWAYCPLSIMDILDRIRSPFNVSNAAQAAGVAAVNDLEFLARSRDHNDKWLPWLTERVSDLGLEAVPSVGNFLLVRFPDQPGRNAVDAMSYLTGRGIIPRSTASAGIPDGIRISIGLEDEMEATAEALAAFMGNP